MCTAALESCYVYQVVHHIAMRYPFVKQHDRLGLARGNLLKRHGNSLALFYRTQVFVTVVAALQAAASVRCGERVLVHAAAGGVGLAALQASTRRVARL